MPANSSAPASDRIRPIREHIYTLPVVRELPAQPADPVGAQSLW
jgi:hypothetical protein